MVTLCRAALDFELRVILDSDILLSSHQCGAELVTADKVV